MALVKTCDNDGKALGGEDTFVQIRGTISDQYEPEPGVVKFRYITYKPNEIHTFCDDECEMEWREKQREKRGFIERPNDY